jgi:hypothetical protein
MTRASFDPSSDTIRTDFRPDTGHAEVHAGREGRAVIVRLTPAEARRLVDQLLHEIRRADRARQG